MCRIIIYCLLTGIFFDSCRAPASYSYTPPLEEAPGKILFASFRMITDSVGTNVITLIKTSTVGGTFKSSAEPDGNPDRVDVHLLDASGNILKTSTTPHPLLRDAEYAKDDGSFEHKTVVLKDAEFFVRVFAPSATSRIQLDEVREGRKVNSTSFIIP